MLIANCTQVILHIVLAVVSPGTTPIEYTAHWFIFTILSYWLWRQTKLSRTSRDKATLDLEARDLERRPDADRT
jgi:hypothetical protein